MSPDGSVLVMDLGGVTCRWIPDRRLVALSRLSGLPPGTVDATVFGSGFDDAGDRGQFPGDAFAAHLRTLLDLPDDPATDAALRAAWAQAFEPDPRVLGLIGRACCPTALFTNNGPLLEAGLAHELATVAAAFDRLLFSWQMGTTKPDPVAFERATEALGVDPAAVFFVDDHADNVAAARAHGWRAHHFRTDLELRAALTEADLLGPAATPAAPAPSGEG